MTTEYFQPLLPLETDEDNRFIVISEALKNVKQKLRMIILTNPGEKLMNPDFGVGINKYLFEPNSGIITYKDNSYTLNSFKQIISQKILSQVDTYATDILINNIQIDSNENTLNLVINYNYRSFIDDSLEIVLGS